MKLRNKHIITVFFVFSAAFFTSNAKAELIEIQLTATVNYLRDDKNFLQGKIHLNDTITGSYIYESTTGDTNPDPTDTTVGDYWHDITPAGISLSTGGFEFKTDTANVNFLVSIGNNHSGRDVYLVRSYNNLPLSGSVGVGGISWQLDDYTATAFSSDALPVTAPIPLSQWQSNDLMIDGGGIGGSYIIHAEVTSAQLVPEPATLLLISLGALMLKKSRRFTS